MIYRDVARKLRTLGCQEIQRSGDGSHRKWWNPATTGGAIIPDWGSRDLKLGTLRSSIRQLGLSWDEFKNA